jgi:hypothetical protein
MMRLMMKVFPKMMALTARPDAVGKSCRSYVKLYAELGAVTDCPIRCEL